MASGRLAGMTALITGGAGGIGSACAARLAQDGAAVVLMGRDAQRLQDAQTALKARYVQAQTSTFSGDAGRENDMTNACEAAFALGGRLDIIVATVGGSEFRPLLEHDADSFLRQIHANLIPSFLAVKTAASSMTQGGSVVCISSNVAKINFLHLSAYVTAKAAVEAFIRSAADELDPNVRVNAVRPGLVAVDRTSRLTSDRRTLGLYAEQTPLATDEKSCAVPSDIAEAVRYLAGPESAWVTGQSFAVDGGQELRKSPDLR